MDDRVDISLTDLPPFLRDVAELTTLGTALALAREFGGTRQYIARRPRQTGKLACVIGLASAEILGRAFGDQHIEIPRFAAKRKLAIARAAGTAAEVARVYGVTERYVRQVRNTKPQDDERQASLFGDDDQVEEKACASSASSK